MKHLRMIWLLLVCAPALAQFIPHAPAKAAYCLNPSNVWIPINAATQTASALPNGAPAGDLYGLNENGTWYALACDASGNLVASPPGGSNGQVQYNNSGAFGGSGLTTDSTGDLTFPSAAVVNWSSALPWTVQSLTNSLSGPRMLFTSASPYAGANMDIALKNNEPWFAAGNCPDYSAADGVITMTCLSGQNPIPAGSPNPLVQFSGFSGSLAPLNGYFAYNATRIDATHFSFPSTAVTGSGTDATGWANADPIATDFRVTDGAGDADLLMGGQVGFQFEYAPIAGYPDAAGESIFTVSGPTGEGSPNGSTFGCDLYSNLCATANNTIDDGAGNAVVAGSSTEGGTIETAAALATAAGQVSFGSTTAAASNCNNSGALTAVAGCLVINVAGTTRYVPYF